MREAKGKGYAHKLTRRLMVAHKLPLMRLQVVWDGGIFTQQSHTPCMVQPSTITLLVVRGF